MAISSFLKKIYGFPSKIPRFQDSPQLIWLVFVGDSLVGEASVDRWSHPVSDRSRTSEIGSDPSSESESMTRPPGGDGGDCNENPLCKEWGFSNLCVSEKPSNEERDTIRNKKFWTIPKSFYTSDGDLKVTASSEWFSWIHIVPVPFAQGTNLHRKIHHWSMSWWKDVLRHSHLRDEFLVLSSAIANLGLL